MTLRYMRSACCVLMATHTQSEYLFCRPFIVKYLRNKNQLHALFDSQFISMINLYMFRAGLLLIIIRYLFVYAEYHLMMISSKPAFPLQQGLHKRSQSYAIRTLPIIYICAFVVLSNRSIKCNISSYSIWLIVIGNFGSILQLTWRPFATNRHEITL